MAALDKDKNVGPVMAIPQTSRPDLSLNPSHPAQRVTSALLNGKNFHAWARSLRLYLGGKRKSKWLFDKNPRPNAFDPTFDEWEADNCVILGWMFNSMEDRIYNMVMYNDTVYGLWTALNNMYAHAQCDSRIFELHQEVSHASQAALGLSIADFFGYLQTRWEELAQYEPLSDFPNDAAVEAKRLDRRHTYQFLMGLKPEYEALRAQILNTSPLPPLYEAFATVDGDERRRRIAPPSSRTMDSLVVPDQMAFAAPSSNRPYCQHCHKLGHFIDRCFELHPELKQQFTRTRGGGRGGSRGGGRNRSAHRTGPDYEEDFWKGV
ncbi:uncharacterized protein LOC119998800 isoform X2 [Tripterygium wilfordii]|uniref:uncharacterized protein LOC119998800 isoform X2 n=1 Tax=Tripterygium wilfordii TaxID=458696 RepID=UPI0018F7F61D|nr:uncharacterized protein LOC119998800 isoform X2 [Tripterygium wilfordii]